MREIRSLSMLAVFVAVLSGCGNYTGDGLGYPKSTSTLGSGSGTGGGSSGQVCGSYNILPETDINGTDHEDDFVACRNDTSSISFRGLSSWGSIVCVIPMLDSGDFGRNVFINPLAGNAIINQCITESNTSVNMSFGVQAQGFNAVAVVPYVFYNQMMSCLDDETGFAVCPPHSYGLVQ